MFFDFLAEHVGKISVVLTGLSVLIGVGAMVAASYVVIPVGIRIAVGVLFGAGLISGSYYLGRENGRSMAFEDLDSEFEEENTFVNIEHINIENDNTETAKEISNKEEDEKRSLTQERISKLEAENAIIKSQFNTLTKRVSKLEGEQATNTYQAALRDLHHERETHGFLMDSSSDSDTESSKPVGKEKNNNSSGLAGLMSNSVFATNKPIYSSLSANDPTVGLGVKPRSRNK